MTNRPMKQSNKTSCISSTKVTLFLSKANSPKTSSSNALVTNMSREVELSLSQLPTLAPLSREPCTVNVTDETPGLAWLAYLAV